MDWLQDPRAIRRLLIFLPFIAVYSVLGIINTNSAPWHNGKYKPIPWNNPTPEFDADTKAYGNRCTILEFGFPVFFAIPFLIIYMVDRRSDSGQ